jgi:hypothetical protein
MKILIISLSVVLITILLVPRLALASVLINQVYYDPIGTQSGGEAVELYNPNDYAIDISNYVIKTKSSNVVLPQDTWINSNSFFLIGDNDFSIHKDNLLWSEADFEYSISLANTNAGVALMFNDTVIDAVGWGNKDNIENYLFLGDPAQQVPKGMSLLRINNTQNNSNDFIRFETWLRGSIIKEEIIDIKIEFVSNEAITNDIIKNVSIETDDLPKHGVQIIPNPGEDKEVIIKVEIEDVNLSEIYVVFNNQNYSMQNEDGYYLTSIFIPYFYNSGKHNITIIAEANDSIEERKIEFEYLPIIAITSSKEIFECINENCTIMNDAPIIKNIGNLPLSLILEKINGNTIKYGISSDIEEWELLENRIKVAELNPSEEVQINFELQYSEDFAIIRFRAGMK